MSRSHPGVGKKYFVTFLSATNTSLSTAGDNYQSLHTNDASAPSRDLVAPLVSLSVAAAVILLFGTCKFTMPALQVGGRPLE